MKSKRYTIAMLGFTGLALSAMAGLNWLVDPYAVYHAAGVAGLTATKPEIESHQRLSKAYQVARRKPRCVLLGSSRTERGLDPLSPALGAWRGASFNLGIEGATIEECRAYLAHAQAVQPLDLAVVGLDYAGFGIGSSRRPDFSPERLRGEGNGGGSPYFDVTSTLLSYDAAYASLRTLLNQGRAVYTAEGLRLPAYQKRRKAPAFRRGDIRRAA